MATMATRARDRVEGERGGSEGGDGEGAARRAGGDDTGRGGGERWTAIEVGAPATSVRRCCENGLKGGFEGVRDREREQRHQSEQPDVRAGE